MLDMPHIREPRPARALGRTLHHLNPLDERRVHFIPHLDTHARQLAAQENRSVHSTPPDVDAYAGEWIAGALAHKQDVAQLCGLGVLLVEQACAGAGGVELGECVGCDGGDGVGACLLDCWSGRDDSETVGFVWKGG